MPRHPLLVSMFFASLSLAAAACGGHPTPPPQTPQSSTPTQVQHQIVTQETTGTAPELLERGERALMAQRWKDAIVPLEALVAAEPDGPLTAQALVDLGAAYEGLGEREKARERYREVAKRFAASEHVKAALSREANIDAYLQDWRALGAVGEALLARKDADHVDKMLGLGARALAKVAAGEDGSAMKDVQDGLDIMEANHYGATGRLPVAAAQLRFALAEIRRVRSERIKLNPPPPDFLMQIELRCAGLLEAQSAYADAIRSIDPQWAMMSGLRLGEMYRVLHKDLMSIPPNEHAKTEQQKQLFYAIMHVRYRALLDKGVEMMRRTIALGEKTGDAGSVKRAEEAKAEMEQALAEEKAQLAKFPFTEAEVERALELMKQNADKKAADAARGKPQKP